MLEPLRHDIRQTIRTVARERGWAASVVATLALAIGANTAMLGLVSRLMLDPPPGIRDAEHVARVTLATADGSAGSATASTTSYPVFRALHALGGAFSAVAAARADTVLVGRAPDVAPIAILGASAEYFTTLGATPLLGRFFLAEEDVPPGGGEVIVLGHAYWQRTFGGDRDVVGRAIVIGDQSFTIIGVARRGFNGDRLASVDAYIPLSTSLRESGAGWVDNRGMNVVSVVVRLRGEVSLSAASQIASAAVHDAAARDGQRRAPRVALASMMPGSDARGSPQSQIALWLLAVSVIVLIIATANVGALTAWLQHRLTYAGAASVPPIGDYLRIGMITGALPFVTIAAAMSALVALSRARTRELDAARFRAQLAESRLEALTAQLQPHFLFNTLQGISTLILSDPPAADRMLAQLSDLLREVLRRGDRREVTLAEELRVLAPYLAISRQRFGDRLSLRVDVDESLDGALVPFFILQPLVENALHHGIGSHAGPGAITVRAARYGDRLELTVVDDGPGHVAPDATRGIGLANTTARLRELYGSACSLELGRRSEGGFRVRVGLPLRTSPP